MIWTEHFCHKFYRRLHWYNNYCSVMQRFLKVTFSYQPANYLEFKLWIMTKSKTKTKTVLMEPINSSKTVILALIVFFHLVNAKLCYYDFIFKDLLILTFKSVFKGLGSVTENLQETTKLFWKLFFIYNILM